MRKFLTLCTEILMALLILCSGMFTAHASEPWSVQENPQETSTYVNGIKSDDIIMDYEISAESYHYRYWGGGTVTGWEFPTLTEGIDYEIISQGADDIELKLLNGKNSIPYINVFVDFEHWPVRSDVQDITAYTNGTRPGHVMVIYTPDGMGYRLIYTAEGVVTGWEFPSMTQGKNYEVIAQKDNYIDIRLINGQDEIPDVNVLIDFTERNEIADAKENDPIDSASEAKNGYSPLSTITNESGRAEKETNNAVWIFIIAGVFAASATVFVIVIVKKNKKSA